MISLAIFVAVSSNPQVEFPGGTPQKLVASLYETFKLPVFVSSSKPVFKPISIKSETTFDLIKKLESTIGLMSSSIHEEDKEDVLTDVVFTNRAIASNVLRRDGRPSDSQLGLSYGDRSSMLKTSDGKVRIQDRSPLNLGNWLLVDKEWSKPLEMHWYVKVLTCAFTFSELSEEQFLTNLSKACIGKFSQSDEGYKIDLDVSRFKQMWIEKHKSRRELEIENPVRVAFHETCIAVLEQTTKAEMTKLMSKPGQFHRFAVSPISSLDNKFRKYLQLYLSGADLGTKSEENAARELLHRNTAFEQADWSKPLEIALYNGGRVDLLIPTAKAKTYIAHSG